MYHVGLLQTLFQLKCIERTKGTNYTATCLPSQKLSKLDEPDMQDTAGEAGSSSYVMYSYGPPHMVGQKQDDQLKHTFSSYVRIRDVALKTYQRQWMIERSGERGSGISVLAAWHDDDEYNWKTRTEENRRFEESFVYFLLEIKLIMLRIISCY